MRVRLLSVLQGVGLAFAAAVVGALVLGLVAAWAPVWDPSDGLLKAINVAAVAAGGVYAGRKALRLGWLHGGAAGLLYVVLATSMTGQPVSLARLATAAWLKDAALAFGAGAAGGMAGVAR